jgi:ABC-type phosphate transport system ATPase subunit
MNDTIQDCHISGDIRLDDEDIYQIAIVLAIHNRCC